MSPFSSGFTKSLRSPPPMRPRSAPRVAPPATAFGPGKALVGMKVAQKFVAKRRSGFNLGAVVGHRDKDKLWGETYDVMLDTEGLDAGMTPEELLLILADDKDKRKAVAEESWTLARTSCSSGTPSIRWPTTAASSATTKRTT